MLTNALTHKSRQRQREGNSWKSKKMKMKKENYKKLMQQISSHRAKT